MRSIHYFPRYSQRENTVTNNTLLLLLRLMDFSRSRFEDFLTQLAGEAELDFAPQWLRIGQQEKTLNSVVDGFIAQDSFKIAVETKLEPVFRFDQLSHHLDAFADEDHRLLMLLAPSRPADASVEEFRAAAKKRRVEVLVTTFEQLIKVYKSVLTDRDQAMQELLSDFEDFCRESDRPLLPSDAYMMFTPPCGPSHKDNEALRLYYCPSDRPLRRAHFLGIYANKKVRAIGRVHKVADCTIDLTARAVSTQGNESLTEDERERIVRAAVLAPSHGWDITHGHRFYLCDDWAETDYRKSSSGGIMGHRMLDLREVFPSQLPADIHDVASGLSRATWA